MWGFFFGHNQCCIDLFYILTDGDGNIKITSTLLHCCDLTMEGLSKLLPCLPILEFGIVVVTLVFFN
jgi:hypothetical protein